MIAIEGAHGGDSNPPGRRRAIAAAVALAGLLSALPAAAQERAVLRGTVVDPDGPVEAAAVRLERDTVLVAVAESGPDGAWRLEARPGRYTLRVSRLGYAPTSRLIRLEAGTTDLVLELQPAAVVIEGVEVEAERSRGRARFEEVAGVSVRELTAEQVRLVPGVAEADPLRAVEVLPGVVSTSDFSSAFHVRGGSQDQNLILLDGVPIFSPFHLGGFFSVFNADMVARAELASGGFPARYGGRVSSVLDVTSDAGDGTFSAEGGVSLLASRLALGGGWDAARDGLGLDALRWRVAGRRSYFDVLLGPFFDFPYYLADLQGVLEATAGRDRFRLTAYSGADVLDLTRLDDEDFPLRIDWDWGNDVLGVAWDRALDDGSWRTYASFTDYGTGLTFPDFDDTEFRSRIDQARLGSGVRWRRSPRLELEVGGSLDRLSYDNLARTGGTDFGRGLGSGVLTAAYAQATWGRAGDWLLETGVRLDRWSPDPGAPVTEVSPRVAAKRFFDEASWALNASLGRYTQFVHSLRDEELPLGLDVWILTGERAPHVVSDQVQAGIELFPAEGWTVALEGYHRSFDGVVTFNPADDPNTDLDDVLVGEGTSWGADLFVGRDVGEVTGWIALSLLKAERTFPDPLSPREPAPRVRYPPIFDRRVDLDVVLAFPAPMGWEGGLRLNVGTGTPYTRPLGGYAYYQPRFVTGGGRFGWEDDDDAFTGGYAVLLGDRNAERYPAYHRLDLSFRRSFEKGWGTLTPHLDILNVYNRRNVLFYFYEYDRSPATRSGISMFPVLPTIGLDVRFR